MLRYIVLSLFTSLLTTFLLYAPHLLHEPLEKGLNINELSNLPKLKVGDIILRQGIGYDSIIISEFSGSIYTHIGIIVSTNPIMILHASTNDDKKRLNQVIVSTLESFLSHAKHIAIKRFYLTDMQREQISLDSYKWIGKPFVLDLDSNALYCSLLVLYVLSPYIKFSLPYTTLDIGLFKGNYLFPKAFYDDKHSYLIYKYK